MGRSQETVGEATRALCFRTHSVLVITYFSKISEFFVGSPGLQNQQRGKHGQIKFSDVESLELIKGFGWSGLADGKMKKSEGEKKTHKWSYINSLRKMPEWILLLWLSRVYSCNCSHYSAIMTGVVMMSDCNSCHFPFIFRCSLRGLHYQ